MNLWDTLPRPILALAPMAGYTDSSYRRLLKEICPRVVCFTEFTSVDGILHGNDATMKQISFHPEKERPIVAQIFGKNPDNFRKVARILTELGVNAIDINMGCPAKKIISSDHGSALLKDPSLAEEIVAATVSGTSLPVSVKMRIGASCYDPEFFFEFAKNMERAGASLITIHGRTSKQMYSGTADWQPMYELKKLLKIPVIGNGDVHSGVDALAKLQNNVAPAGHSLLASPRLGLLDGLMVGRATFGNPWVMAEIAAAFDGKPFTAPTWSEKLPWIKRHAELSCEFKGEKWGMLEMRKHLAWYIRGIPNASEMRAKLIRVETLKEGFEVLEGFQLV